MSMHTQETKTNYNLNTVNTIQTHTLNIKNQKKSNIQIWHQAFENKKVDLLALLDHHQVLIDDKCAMILDDKSVGGHQKQLDLNKAKGTEKNKSNSSILPLSVQKKINKLKQLNLDMKKHVEEISKLNASYVIKHGGKYINVENPDRNKESALPNIKEKEAPKNFRYISDNYRSQLMRAFLNYNPKIHLANLRTLIDKADPAIQNDLKKLWRNIEADLSEVLDPHFHRKKYEKMIENNRRALEHQNDLFSALSAIEPNESRSSIAKKLSSSKISQMPIAGLESRKKTNRKVIKDNEFDSLKDFTTAIIRGTSERKIEDFIDSVKDETSVQIDKHIASHFKEIKLAEEVLKSLPAAKLNKNIDQEIKDIKADVFKLNEGIANDILTRKTNLINAIHSKTHKI